MLSFRLLVTRAAVAVLGEVDRRSAASFRTSVVQAVAELEWPVLDLGGLRYVDSVGAMTLAEVLRSTRAATRNVTPDLRKIWALLGLEASLLA